MHVLLFAIVLNGSFLQDAAAPPARDWVTTYYLDPSPDRFVEEVRGFADMGLLKRPESQPPIAIFLSQVMRQNPSRIAEWLDHFQDLDPPQHKLLLDAAWFSNTPEARAYLQEHNHDQYLQRKPPDLPRLEIRGPNELDMLWGYFFATGDPEAIRQLVSAFSFSKYQGALERYKDSKKTDDDRKAALGEATFRAALWSIESNSRQHPRVLEIGKQLLDDPEIPADHRKWLGAILEKIESETPGDNPPPPR